MKKRCAVPVFSALYFNNAPSTSFTINKEIRFSSTFQVKRLYDTFHEPFKRVPTRPNIIVPDTPDRVKNKGEPSSATDGGESGKDAQSPGNIKDSNVSVKSALSAAFAKYNERMQNRGTKRNLRAIGEASGSTSDTASKED